VTQLKAAHEALAREGDAGTPWKAAEKPDRRNRTICMVQRMVKT